MIYNKEKVDEIFKIYKEIKEKIDNRLNEFNNILKNGKEDDFIYEFNLLSFNSTNLKQK